MDQVQLVISTWGEVWAVLAGYLIKLIAGLIFLVILLLVAKFIERLIVQGLKIARFDVLSEKVGIAGILAKGEIKHTLSELIGMVVYWLLVLVFVIITMSGAGLQTAGFIDAAVKYAGEVVLAIFVLVLGLALAATIGTIVRAAASNAGIAIAKNLGQISQAVIVVFTILTILPMVGVKTDILYAVIQIVLAAVGLGAALAFGLGSKDIAGKTMAEIVDKWKKK